MIIIAVYFTVELTLKYSVLDYDKGNNDNDDGREVCKLVTLSSDLPEGYIVMSRQDLRENA